ncbi:hypothetical protein TNCV_4261971 [Trichonephila clavipes]|nr:hypothetical protein TNCV_4261971 [Trichonephila clavipes]
MDICECIVPLQHGDTLNSRQAASPLVRLVEERWEVPERLHTGCPPSKFVRKRAKSYCLLHGAQSHG